MKRSILISLLALPLLLQSCDKGGGNEVIIVPPGPQKDTTDKPVEPEETMPDNVVASNSDILAIWGDTNEHYAKDKQITKAGAFYRYSAWRNEKISAEAVLWAKKDLSNVTLTVSDLAGKEDIIPASAINVNFLGYVTGETWYYTSLFPSNVMQVADLLDNKSASVNIAASTAQPVWVSVKVPKGTKAGIYKGTVDVTADNMEAISLPVWLKVVDRVLPDPADWKFHLDIWQNPGNIGALHNMIQWSSKHLEALKPYLRMLADAGQKCITVTIGGGSQTMPRKILQADGTWRYDYHDFDVWVNTAMECGITGQIDCYGLVPWACKFDYYNEAQKKNLYLEAEPGTKEYEEYWTSLLKDFKNHLSEKGWLDKTYIAFDERPEDKVLLAVDLLKKVAPEIKVSYVGEYSAAIEALSDVYCIHFNQEYPSGKVAERNGKGLQTLFYTAIGDPWPNTFLESPLAEATWYGWTPLAKGYTGFLRWASTLWEGADPTIDPRGPSHPPTGDRFLIYPDAQSSARFEKIVEGVQDYEKALILRAEWAASGDNAKISAQDAVLSKFTESNIPAFGADKILHEAKMTLE